MRKISFQLSRAIVQALAQICSSNLTTKTGDNLFDIWLKDSLEALLIKLAKLRNKTAKLFTVSFTLTELLCIREVADLHRLNAPAAPQLLLVDSYILFTAQSINV